MVSKEIISFHTSLKGVLVQLCCLPMKDNIETETHWLKFAEKVISQRKCISWTKSEKLIKEKQRVGSDFLTSSKSSIFDFFGPGFLLHLAQSDLSLWPFHGDSYFSIFWGMWQIHFFCAMQQVRQECQHSAGNFIAPFILWNLVLATLKNSFSRISHSI